MAEESCKIQLGNTGEPGCFNIADVARLAYLDMAKDSTGAVKERDNDDLTMLALLNPILNADSPLDRLFPLGKLDQVSHTRADDVFFTSNSGEELFIREGFKIFEAMIFGAPRELVGKLNDNGKQDFGFHFLDDKNQIVTKKGTTNLKSKPILIANQTFRAKYFEKSDSDPAGVGIRFQWRSSEKDENIKVLTGVDYSREDIEGLLDADAVYSGIIITEVIATITTTCFGDPVPGLLITDFTLEEISPTPGAIVITSVDETAPGVYTIVFPPATSGDVVRLSADKDKFDFAAMSDGTNDITIP